MKGPKNQWREREFDRKRVKKISMLKKYAKLVKREGLSSTRVHVDGQRTEAMEEQDQDAQHHPRPRQPRNKKQNSEEETIQQQRAQQEEERRQKLKQRKEQHKVMTQRTKKGQPVMAGRIKNILDKLVKEQVQ